MEVVGGEGEEHDFWFSSGGDGGGGGADNTTRDIKVGGIVREGNWGLLLKEDALDKEDEG